MIGVVIPVHNEEALLEGCLQSVSAAASEYAATGEEVHIVVVLDDCSDASHTIARRFPVAILRVAMRNVGVARSVGVKACLAHGARWLAFTDADTIVSRTWLIDQLALEADAVCGTIGVEDWSAQSPGVRLHFEANYVDKEGHRHIHGANLGVSAAAYARAGGFLPVDSSEDVALVRALTASGAVIAWTAQPRVVTSARRDFRAPRGFGATLLEQKGSVSVPEVAAC